ncbi:MAG: hypothetical protein F6J87_14670 [Spirulina sp. SIO3F2]|nr:hypothetical protein [Spirulina sp. SIO3F2]
MTLPNGYIASESYIGRSDGRALLGDITEVGMSNQIVFGKVFVERPETGKVDAEKSGYFIIDTVNNQFHLGLSKEEYYGLLREKEVHNQSTFSPELFLTLHKW